MLTACVLIDSFVLYLFVGWFIMIYMFSLYNADAFLL